MPVELSRRAALTTALTGAAALGVAASRSSDAATAALPKTTDAALHAARRLTFGATPAVVDRIRSIGLAAWVDEQLTTDPDPAGEVAGLGTTTLPLPAMALRATQRDVVADLQGATFARAAWGDLQLREVLVELWSNHLSVAAANDAVGPLKAVDDREVVRAHVLGSFSDMLTASMQSPAMLRYLSNAGSRAPMPNENYARELLELHTVGVRGGYTQRDVRDAAKVLTGLSVDDHGAFVYRPEWHVTGPVRVLDWRSSNRAADAGLDVALSLGRYLAAHPATAHRVAEKLVRRFVSDTPPAGLVASAARVYRAQGTQLAPVVRHVILSKEFAHAADKKVQRPFEWATHAVRALGLKQDVSMHADPSGVVGMLAELGQLPFGWPQPDGYPDAARAWATTASMLARWNAAQALVSGQVKGIAALDVAALVGTPAPATVGELADRVARRILLQPPRRRLVTALVRSTGRAPQAALSSSGVTVLAPGLAALVLSSPEAQVR